MIQKYDQKRWITSTLREGCWDAKQLRDMANEFGYSEPFARKRPRRTSMLFSMVEISAYRMAWAKLWTKVYYVDAEQCPNRGVRLRLIGAVCPQT